jgi:septal ring factor EnvC (AmiA/AmiB activator)
MVSRPRIRLVLTLAMVGMVHAFGVGFDGAYAEDDQELAAKLKQIRSEVESAESEIARMKEEFTALLAKRTQLEESVRRIKAEDKAIQNKVLELKERAVVLTAEVAASEKRALEQQRKIQARLKAMYINTSVSVSPVMAGRAARGDLERLSLYARKVRDFDSRLFKDASDAVAALMRNRSDLDESLIAEEKLREQLKKKRKDAETESAKLKSVTEQLVAKQKAAHDSLALLQGEAKKVEEMIASLTSGSDDEVDEEAPEEEPRDASGEVEPKPEAPVIQKTVMHPSLFDAGSKPTAPVRGEVLQNFGRSKLTNFADMVRSKGIEFSTPPGSEVHVVLGGKVVFAGVMPGYDQVVVVEHGGRSYSLYGRLGTVTVTTGDLVTRDQAIATTSNPDAKGRNFYFEVRKNGAPVNPETVLIKVSR